MKNGEKHYIKFLGIKLIKIKQISKNKLEVYLSFLPLFTFRTKDNKTNINILFIQKFYDHIRKNWKKYIGKSNKINIFKRFQNGEKLKICLTVSRPGTWNYDYLYKLLVNDKRFETIVLVMPDPFQGKQAMLEYVTKTENELTLKNIPFVTCLDPEMKVPINIRDEINPDIILYSDFWEPHFFDEHYIREFLDRITLLNEYGYSVMQDEKTCNFELNNLVDLYFRPTNMHLDMCRRLMNNGGKNVAITGSPKLDAVFDPDYKAQDVWINQDKPKKRIIWAPHHNRYTSADMYCCDAFWEIYDYMLEIAKKYKDEIQIAFRPHPMLKNRIKKYWGEYVANEYFKKWETLENTQVSEGNFIDLFLTSDAMIMDSCSFLAEYTAVNKPLFYTRTKTSKLNLNEFGEKLFENVYDTKDVLTQDIENFIQEVVINGNDYKKEQRTEFINNWIKPQGANFASENIYNTIVKYLEEGVK